MCQIAACAGSPGGYAPLQRFGWYRRAQAWALTKGDEKYDAALEPYRQQLFGQLRGEVLELGPGAGRNLRFFRKAGHWIGVEPNEFAHDHLKAEARRLGMKVDVRTGTAESLPVADASVDAVACSLVLCSVTDVEATLREVVRVLRPGGRFVFVEHVAAPRGSVLRRMQTLFKGVQRVIGDGCTPDRETWAAINSVGFSSVDMELARMPIPMPLLRPHIIGSASR